MKVKLADGTEVEVADTDPIAIATRELESIKGLGFDSVDAYTKSIEADRDKFKEREEDGQAFIDRQKGELGDLRKKLNKKEPIVKDGKVILPEKDAETPEEREENYRKRNNSVQTNLTDDERSHAETEFLREYDASTPDERILLKTHEGRNAFMKAVFPTKETDEKSPISLFEKPSTPELSIGERVAKALIKDDQGRGRRPVIPQSTGSGFTPRPDVKPVSKPMQVGSGRGGIREALQFAEANN